jgi:hypothetical protein
MKEKMPWLKTRLRALKLTPAGLARHLGIAPPRVYEMIAGRRYMQPNEIGPTAEYLQWPIEELLANLPEDARNVPSTITLGGNMAIVHGPGQGMIPVLATTRTADMCEWDCLLTGETLRYVACANLHGRPDVQCLYMYGRVMEPWRDPGDPVLFEMDRPPKERDYVVIYLTEDKRAPKELRPMQRVMVRQLLWATAKKFRLRQHNPAKDTEIDVRSVISIFRVMTWDDLVRLEGNRRKTTEPPSLRIQ